MAKVGGYQDKLGIIDVGGREVNLDPREVAFGPTGAIGLVLVVVADPDVKQAADLR